MNLEQFKIMLVILLQNDRRVQCCTITYTESSYIHIEEKCPRCIAIKILES